MKTQTNQKIIDYIAVHGDVTVNELVAFFGFTQAAIHRQLNKLLLSNKIIKSGTPPRVYYHLARQNTQLPINQYSLDQKGFEVINERFMYITPLGHINYGVLGFETWCERFSLNITKTAQEYLRTLEKYDEFKRYDFIDGTSKLTNTFQELFIDQVYYLDFYSIERFGKTKLGALVLYAKQSQNVHLIKEVATLIKPRIEKLIEMDNIESICFIPHTLPRKVQFMNEIEKHLHLSLPKIKLVKVINDIPIAQKTLNKLEDRILNASSTIFTKEGGHYKSVLLVDDAVGSGATLNEVAKKIKARGLAQKVIAVGITGSYKGFEVLNEV